MAEITYTRSGASHAPIGRFQDGKVTLMIHNTDARAIELVSAIVASDDSQWTPLFKTECEYRAPVAIAIVGDDFVTGGFATIRPTDIIGEVAIAIVDEAPFTTNVYGNHGIFVLDASNGIPRDIVAALIATSARQSATRRNTAKRVATPHILITPNGVTVPTHNKCGNVQSVLANGNLTCQPCASASAAKSNAKDSAPTVADTDAFDPMAEFLASDESASA